MEHFNALLTAVINLFFPILCYLVYLVFKKKSYGEEQELMFEIFLFSSLYLTLKMSPMIFDRVPLILCDIPFLIALMKGKKNIAFLVAVLILLQKNVLFEGILFSHVLEYGMYIFFYEMLSKKKTGNYAFVFFVTITKLCFALDIFDRILILMYPVLGLLCVYIYERIDHILKFQEEITSVEQEQSLRNSVFTITHEIKNPLAVCKGYLELCDHHKDQRDKYIQIMKGEIERTLVILDDFMNLSKIKIHKEEMDVNLLLEDLLDSTKILCENKKIKVENDFLDEDIYIDADYNRLKQVLINIMKNSIEASKEHGQIQIQSSILKKDAVITITDNGIGMDEKTIAKLGSVYFTTKNYGSGIGVNFSNEVIKRHAGSIEYESKVNQGTKVIIKLPMIIA